MIAQPEISVQTILFLSANPKNTDRLRLDQELRDIEEGLELASNRDQFKLTPRVATRPRDIRRAMLKVNPQIIHFSGHGEGEAGLVFEDEKGQAKLVDGAALAGLFELFADQLICVVLNGCYTQVQAQAIAKYIPYVIGMPDAIGDRGAIEFSVGFYDALWARNDVEFAYRMGCNAMEWENIPKDLAPVLLKNTEEELVERLWTLDYDEAFVKYKRLRQDNRSACAVLISIQKDSDRTQKDGTQNWIVKRLAREIPNFAQSDILSIKPSTLESGGENAIDSLRQELSRTIGIGDGASTADLMDAICQKASQKPVIIAIYDIEDCSDIGLILEQFLNPLLTQAEQQVKKRHVGIFVYVVGDLSKMNSPKSMMSGCSSLVRLDDLHEISNADVESWLIEDKTRDYAYGCRGKQYVDRLLEGEIDDWPTQPQEVLKKIICDVFQLKFSDVAQYWKLEKAG